MTHISSKSIKKVPYCFSRSSVKVTWAEKLRLQGRLQLSNPSELPGSILQRCFNQCHNTTNTECQVKSSILFSQTASHLHIKIHIQNNVCRDGKAEKHSLSSCLPWYKIQNTSCGH